MESWLLYAMDLYDKKGRMPAIRAFQDVAEFADNMQEKLVGTVLEDVSGVLERFVCGLNGRRLAIAPADQGFTDTESILLPHVIGHLPQKEANFRLYKAMTVHQWAQNWYGTWRGGALLGAVSSGHVQERHLDLLHALETLGDHFAIYGFSGWTRKRCEAYPVKRFDQPYDDAARGRICGIDPRDYTVVADVMSHACRRRSRRSTVS